MSGKSRADLAAILERGADGAYFAGIMLEFGMAAHSPLGLSMPAAITIGMSTPDVDIADPERYDPTGGYAPTPAEARCRAARFVSAGYASTRFFRAR